ncbi:MAG: type 1 glutamine amidotransferase [Salinirussus sp.]
MSRLRIALLNAAESGDHTRRNFRREIDADLVEYDAGAGQVPPDFAFDAAVVTGSRASVYWDEPWIGSLKQWVGDAVESGLPFLGVCYGHQLLADVLGGRVEGMGEYEIGYRTVEHDGSVLFEGIDREFTAFTTHSDRVVELPPGAERIAVNDYGIHGFRCGDVFTVQFHPEYDLETAETVTRAKDDQLSEATMERVLDGITEENYDAACETKALFDNFTRYVRDRRHEEARATGTAGD